jgi:hypothetical protein
MENNLADTLTDNTNKFFLLRRPRMLNELLQVFPKTVRFTYISQSWLSVIYFLKSKEWSNFED